MYCHADDADDVGLGKVLGVMAPGRPVPRFYGPMIGTNAPKAPKKPPKLPKPGMDLAGDMPAGGSITPAPVAVSPTGEVPPPAAPVFTSGGGQEFSFGPAAPASPGNVTVTVDAPAGAPGKGFGMLEAGIAAGLAALLAATLARKKR